MSSQHEIAKPQDVKAPQLRHVDDTGWQVLWRSTDQQHICRREHFIASGLRTVAAVTRGEACGLEVAEEVDAVAAVAAREGTGRGNHACRELCSQ